MTKDEEIAIIETALNELLNAILAHDSSRPRRPIVTYTFAQIADLPTSGAAYKAEQLCEDPVGTALRFGVRDFGKRLYELGGLSAMQEACDRVANMDAQAWSIRTDIMDKRWDGIGSEGDGVGWAS